MLYLYVRDSAKTNELDSGLVEGLLVQQCGESVSSVQCSVFSVQQCSVLSSVGNPHSSLKESLLLSERSNLLSPATKCGEKERMLDMVTMRRILIGIL